jgi:hypothetical protein
LSSWGWAQSCSKHVEDSNKHFIEEIVRRFAYLPELTMQYFAQCWHIPSKIHVSNLTTLSTYLSSCRSQKMLKMLYNHISAHMNTSRLGLWHTFKCPEAFANGLKGIKNELESVSLFSNGAECTRGFKFSQR